MLFKLSTLNSNLALTLGYLNPALNNSALKFCGLRISMQNLVSIKLHVYGKRQTSDSSVEFLKIENEQIRTAQNNSSGQKLA